jgi:hypothetical protein
MDTRTVTISDTRLIVAWRYETLIHAGYPPDEARALADELDVDLHEATSLLRRGCPPETATRILL